MLTPWKKSYDQPRYHIQKQDITLPTKICLVKAMAFPVVVYGCMPGASVRNSTCDKVMWQSSDGKANQTSGFPPGISWASTPPKIRICLLFHSSDILWKKSNQGFSLLHLKGMFQLNPSDNSLACLTGSPGPLTACELLTAPQPREAQSLKAS